MASNKMLSVALDFGTSYSGYAFSFYHDKEKIFTSKWPGNGYYIKAPTSILFNPDMQFDSFGFEAEDKYAELSEDGTHIYWYLFKWFKLVLIKKKKLSRNTVIRDVTGKEMLAMDVISAGIQFLNDKMLQDLHHFPIIRYTDIQWVLTVPAIWDDAAKQFMRLAAIKAGIRNESLTLVLEPDAAAMSNSCSSIFAVGEKYMILDCGGGTIDVAIMKKNSRGSVESVYKPTGGVWGGTKVDDAFLEFLITHFGLDRFQLMEKNDVLQVQRSFETAKKKAQKPDARKVAIWLPLTLREDIDHLPISKNIRGDKLILSSNEIVSFFQKPVSCIVSHLQKIVTDPDVYGLSYITMVGGFSESEILQSVIRSSFPTIEVLVAEDPSSAVLKGAVVLGHNPKVIESKRSAYTYGIKVITGFIDNNHDFSKLTVIDGQFKYKDVFDKVMGINEIIKINETKVERMYCPAYFGQKEGSIAIYRSKSFNPRYVTDPGCEQIGHLRVNMPDLTGEKDRQVQVTVYFGKTELYAEAVDRTTGTKYAASFDFL